MSSQEMQHPFKSLWEQARWDEYLSVLDAKGLDWVFNLDRCGLVVHLAPLYNRPAGHALTPRLKLLCDAVEPYSGPEIFGGHYIGFCEAGDRDAAAAAVLLGIMSILESGAKFSRLEPWQERLGQLLQREEDLSLMARSALFLALGSAQCAGSGKLCASIKSFEAALTLAERAEANTLALMTASVMMYPLINTGDFVRAELLIFDATPLSQMLEVSATAKVSIAAAQAFLQIHTGKAAEAQATLNKILVHESFNCLPIMLWAAALGNCMRTAVMAGDQEEARLIAERLRDLAVPEKNHYLHGFLHHYLAMDALGAGDSLRALIHSQESIKRIQQAQCPFARYLMALLLAQTLSETGDDQRALEHLDRWLTLWQRDGYCLQASLGALEKAHILAGQGLTFKARQSFKLATSLLKGQAALPASRPLDFVENLQKRLFPKPRIAASPEQGLKGLISIKTFGGLRIHIQGSTLADRRWQSGRTMALLKALIVFGGGPVSSERLCDLLWPDMEGDLVQQRLKVAIYRLRRIGLTKGAKPLPWILVKHKRVSLARRWCQVDSLEFLDGLKASLGMEASPDDLIKALDLYEDDFLVNDINEAWIVRHREYLRDQFSKGAMALARVCSSSGRAGDALPYLQQALERSPLREELYADLMQVYLELGFPAQALQVFKQAQENLHTAMGVEPGPTLTSLAKETGVEP